MYMIMRGPDYKFTAQFIMGWQKHQCSMYHEMIINLSIAIRLSVSNMSWFRFLPIYHKLIKDISKSFIYYKVL